MPREEVVASAADGERKTVTLLFADIKGSMELIEDLDPWTPAPSSLKSPHHRRKVTRSPRLFSEGSTADGFSGVHLTPLRWKGFNSSPQGFRC